MNVILLLILSYFLGSIPTAYILAKSLKGVDIRKVGSGNPGATNITRIAGVGVGLLVFVIDALKGFIPVIISKNFFPIEILPLVMFSAISGHIFSIFLSFNGGKGVSTFFGCILGFSLNIFLVCSCVFILVLLITRWVSLSSIFSVLCFVVLVFLFRDFDLKSKIIFLLISILIIFRHKENIKRILKFQESKIF
jgi:glycerol-3-phosphate acyltransferase PlsY